MSDTIVEPAKSAGFSLGLRYMVESAFYFSLMSVFVKLAGQTVPVSHIVLARSVVAFTLSLVMLRMQGIPVFGVRRDLLALRGAFGVGGLICFYYSVTELPLADATTIHYTNPIMVALAAGFFLSEKITRGVVAATLACVVGVILVARPEFLFGGETVNQLAVWAAVGGAVFSAGAYTTVRKLGQTDHPLVVVFWFPMIALPFVLPWAIWNGYVPSLYELLILLGVGVSTQFAQVRMTQGLQLESAARATSMTYLQVVFAFVWGLILFGEVPSWTALAGACMIVGALAMTSGLFSRKKSAA